MGCLRRGSFPSCVKTDRSPCSSLSQTFLRCSSCGFVFFLVSGRYLSCPPHIARHLKPEIQELLGYSLADFALGYASAPELKDLPDPELVKFHEAAPLSTECVFPRLHPSLSLFLMLPLPGNSILAPEVLLGRAPRPWLQAAGTNKNVDLLSAELGVETVHTETQDAEHREQLGKIPKSSGEQQSARL